MQNIWESLCSKGKQNCENLIWEVSGASCVWIIKSTSIYTFTTTKNYELRSFITRCRRRGIGVEVCPRLPQAWRPNGVHRLNSDCSGPKHRATAWSTEAKGEMGGGDGEMRGEKELQTIIEGRWGGDWKKCWNLANMNYVRHIILWMNPSFSNGKMGKKM